MLHVGKLGDQERGRAVSKRNAKSNLQATVRFYIMSALEKERDIPRNGQR